jgi:hypothetical protein
MPSDIPKPYRVSIQILCTLPTLAHPFSVQQSSLLPLSVRSSEQVFCWPVSDKDVAPLGGCVEAHGKVSIVTNNLLSRECQIALHLIGGCP